MLKIISLIGLSLCASAAAAAGPAKAQGSPVFFDDFSYQTLAGFYHNGWKARTQSGHPGLEGASWSAIGLSFPANVAGAHNGVIRMSSVTDGTGANTRQTQICHARKYREGTYAARVFFRNTPIFGPDGDEVIESFYAISPLKAPMDKDYSETDFEYLPNGGWGSPHKPAMWTTSWETFQLKPWTKDNQSTQKQKSYTGWHTLLLTVANNQLYYYVDGQLFAQHQAKYYPEVPMSINFNLWFMPKGADGSQGPVDSPELREYREDIDWVYHRVGTALTTKQVTAQVAALRKKGQTFIDTVPAHKPPLPSPCGL